MNLGTLAGCMAALGIYLVFWFFLARRPNLVKRVEPYLRVPVAETSARSGTRPLGFLNALAQFSAPWYRDVTAFINRLTGQNKALRDRLNRAGSELTPTEFRSQQVLWATAGLALALILAIPLALSGRAPAPVALIIVVLLPVTAALGRDWLLSQAVTKREMALARQLPTITELLALAVGAGESPLAALERVTARTDGVLSSELRRTVSEIHSGTPMDIALKTLGQRSEVPAIARFADSIAVAIERGTPIAQVLHDQARDAREEARRHLMELSGRKEIAMLVPVIFFILPVTVLFAIFPGMTALQSGL